MKFAEYRSAIFTYSPEQADIAKRVKEEVQTLHSKELKGQKIVTEIVPATQWYKAEDYHQEYIEVELAAGNRPYECPTHKKYW